MEKTSLFTGDYTIKGLESILTIERKSLGDWVKTCIHDWIRFRKQLYRMAGMDLAAIVVEANVGDVWERKYETEALPQSIIGKAHACLIDHGVPVIWGGDRKYCIPLVERIFIQAAEKMLK